MNLANIHYERDELGEADAIYEKSIRIDPECLEAYFNPGNIITIWRGIPMRSWRIAKRWRSTRSIRRRTFIWLPRWSSWAGRPSCRIGSSIGNLIPSGSSL